MFICICNAVTEQEIIESISNGNDSLKKLQKDLGIAISCGCCKKITKDYIDKYTSKKNKITITEF